MVRQTTIPVLRPTRDVHRFLSGQNSEWNYNDLLLEMVAQYDPSKSVLADLTDGGDDTSYEEKVAYVCELHGIPADEIDDLDLDLDVDDEDVETGVDATGADGRDTDEQVTP